MEERQEDRVPIEHVFGARVKGYRQALRLKQEVVGQAVGFSKSTISEIEHGKYAPALEKAVALARFFGVSVEAMMLPEGAVSDVPWLSVLRHMALVCPNEVKWRMAEGLEAFARELKTTCEVSS